MKRYKLLKDLPTFNAGDEFELRDDGCLYYSSKTNWDSAHWKENVMAYHRRTLERFPNILEDWFEEVKEPAGWRITVYGGISRITKNDEPLITYLKEIGNYFNDKESAYDALEKLKAWKRLKDKGFRFNGWNVCDNGKGIIIFANYPSETKAYLDLLFGGEE